MGNKDNTMLWVVLGLGVAVLSSSSIAGGLASTGNLPGFTGTTPAPEIPVPPEDTEEAVNGLDGGKLITVGANSMVVEGSSCSQGRIRFSEEKGTKWIWRLRKIGSYNQKDIYTIESDYKNFDAACDARWLTAPSGCSGAPYLAKRQSGPRQSWMIYSSGGGFQIRNLSCVRGRYENTYLMASGNAKNRRPTFTSGGGSTFSIENPTGSDVL